MLKVFSADWCGPCKQLKKLLQEHNIEYTAINIDEAPEASRAAGIRGIPTMLNTETGKSLVGAVTLAQIKELIA